MDYAYALTGHDYQGATVDKIIVAMSSTEQLADQKSFYVAVSRARDQVDLMTDNVERLAERLTKQTGETIPALEAWLAARLEREKEARATEIGSAKANRDDDRDPAVKTTEKTDDKATEREAEDCPSDTRSLARLKQDVLLSMATPEGEKTAKEILDEMQQKQRGDLER